MPDIRKSEKYILTFFKSVEDPQEIVEKIRDDPHFGRRSSRAYGIRISLAERILTYRNSLPGKKFTSVDQIDNIRYVGPDTLHDIIYSLTPPTKEYPLLLLPVRIETRFINESLYIRIYPDDIAIDTHNPTLTVKEKQAGDIYREQLAAASTAEDRKAAFRKLCRMFGQARALWIAKKEQEPAPRENDWDTVPKVRVLPDYFVVFLYRYGKCAYTVRGKSIPDELPLMVHPQSEPENEDSMYDNRSKWVIDFAAASECGMAVKVDLQSGEDFFDKIIVVGVRNRNNPAENQELVRELIENHVYTNGFSFLSHDTPTNNSERNTSAYSAAEDLDVSPPDSGGGPEQDESEILFSRFLGLESVVADQINPVTTINVSSYSRNLRQALWPALGDYFFKEMLDTPMDNDTRLWLGEFYTKYVHAGGHSAAVRVGNQPYGLLPVSDIYSWQSWSHDPVTTPSLRAQKQYECENGLHLILSQLFGYWRLLTDNSPRIGISGDADRELLEVLAMEPRSVDIHTRPIVDDRFIFWLLYYLSGAFFAGPGTTGDSAISVFYNIKQWLKQAAEGEKQGADLLKALLRMFNISDIPLKSHPVMRTYQWGNGIRLPFPLVKDEDNPDDDMFYLDNLLEDDIPAADTSHTLLFYLLRQGLRYKQLESDSSASEKIKQAILSLRESGINSETMEKLTHEVLDTHTHRVDSWISAFPFKRLMGLRNQNPTGLLLGCFGWVENLSRKSGELTQGQFITAPSLAQAASGAVMRNAYLTHKLEGDEEAFRLNLTSERIRKALFIIDTVKQGQPLGAVLGYLFERRLHEAVKDMFIDPFRNTFPLTAHKLTPAQADEAAEEVSARNVVDGMSLVNKMRSENGMEAIRQALEEKGYTELDINEIHEELNRILDDIDSVSDVLLKESLYQAVQGNYERSSAALDAFSGTGLPPRIESLQSKPQGVGMRHKVCILLKQAPAEIMNSPHPREKAEPRLAYWISDLLGPLDRIGCRIHVTFRDQDEREYQPVDLNSASPEELADLPGIGEELARDIIEFRDSRGLLHRPRDVMQVDGIGESIYNGLASLVTTEPFIVRLSDLNLCAADILYLSAVHPQNEKTDLERLILYHTHSHLQFSSTSTVEIDFDRNLQYYSRSLNETIQMGKAVLNLLAECRYLNSLDLFYDHGTDVPDKVFQEDTCTELENRLHTIHDNMERLRDDPRLLPDNPDMNILLELFPYGLEGAIPEVPDFNCEHVKNSLQKQIVKRLETALKFRTQAQTHMAGESEDRYKLCVKNLIKALKALLGENFFVLPVFTLTQAEELNSAFRNPAVLGTQRPDRIKLWFDRCAQTHHTMQLLEDLQMTLHAWASTAVAEGTDIHTALTEYEPAHPASLHVVQMPDHPLRRWMALSDTERAAGLTPEELSNLRQEDGELLRPQGIVSIVCYAEADTDFSHNVAGFMIDEWNEFIPNPEQQAGVSFQFDRPNSQAPQTMLMVVPSIKPKDDTVWSHDELRDILEQTLDLAKVRTVDIDSFKTIDRFTPALFLPTDPDNPGWQRELAGIFRRVDFDNYEEGRVFSDAFAESGFIFSGHNNSETSIQIINHGGDVWPDLEP